MLSSRLNSDFNFQEKNIYSNIAKINSLKKKFEHSLNSQLFFKNYEDPIHFENFKKILFEVNLLLKEYSFKEFDHLYQNLSDHNNSFEKDLFVILLALLIDNGFTSSQNSLNKENISFYKTFYLRYEEDNAELVVDLIQSKYTSLFKKLLRDEFNNIFPYCATNEKLSISFDLKEIYFITGNVKYFYLKSSLVHEIPIFKNLKDLKYLKYFDDFKNFFEQSGEWTHNIGYEISLNLKSQFTYIGSLLNNSTENEFHLIKEIINLISNEIEAKTIKMLYSWLSSVKSENQLSHLK